MRMSVEDQKDPAKKTVKLRREFIQGKRDREKAMMQLAQRQLQDGKTPAQFAYEVSRITN